MRSYVRGLIATTLVLAIPLGGCDSTPQESSPPITVSGTVTCSSQAPVAGIWIAATKGQDDSDFALWQTPDTNKPWIATYQYELPHGGTYNVHVGCGQDPTNQKEWVNENWSKEAVSGTNNSFICDDPLANQGVGICRRVE